MKTRRKQLSTLITFKVILIGDSGTGKTALIEKFVTGDFKPEVNVTVGVDFSSKTLKVEGQNVRLQIWDTSGQDIYKSVTRNFYRGASAVFLVYSIADRNTFNHLSEWLEEFYEKGSKEAFVFLVGTKSDLKSRVSAEEAFQLMKSIEGAFCIETCSKEGDSVKTLFQKAAESMYKLYTISDQYRQLVNRERLTATKQSDIKTSLSLQETRSIILDSSRRKRCC